MGPAILSYIHYKAKPKNLSATDRTRATAIGRQSKPDIGKRAFKNGI